MRRVYFYDFVGDKPLALVEVSPVGGPFPEELQGRLPPVVEWQGHLFYWQEGLGGYRKWVLRKDLERIDEGRVVGAWG